MKAGNIVGKIEAKIWRRQEESQPAYFWDGNHCFFGEAGPSGMDENVTLKDLEDDNDDSASFEIPEAKPHLHLHLGFSEKN